MTQTEALYIVVWFHRKPSLKALLTTRCQPSVDFRGLCGKLSTYSSWYPRRSDTLYLGVFLDRTLTPSILPLGAGKTDVTIQNLRRNTRGSVLPCIRGRHSLSLGSIPRDGDGLLRAMQGGKAEYDEEDR